MDYHVVTVEELNPEADVWAVFDEELRKAQTEGTRQVAVCLRKEMGAGIALVEWLGKWQKSMSDEQKKLIIVAEDAQQLETLEFSHPDQQFVYVSSVDRLETLFPAFAENESAAQTEPAQSTTETAPPLPDPDSAESASRTSPSPSSQPMSSPMSSDTKEIRRVPEGGTFDVSGEYACVGCGRTRMYAKGDKAHSCENPECGTPSVGWKLVFELF